MNSPVTTSVTGQLSKIVTIAAGFVLFTETHPSFNNVIGVLFGLAGGVYYAYLKMSSNAASKPTVQMDRTKFEEQTSLLPTSAGKV